MIKDITSFLKSAVPAHAEGKFCIDLTDPITKKVKERVEGKNHVFTDSLFSGDNRNWVDTTSTSYLVLNDSIVDVNADMPYLLGQNIGYGRPSMAGSGSYRGAYNSANQVLASSGENSMRWKFQYDFTTAQANGTIGTIGLTHQHTSTKKIYIQDRRIPIATYNGQYTSDGRYSYSCSSVGIVTRYDNTLGTATTIDISSIVGTSDNKTVCYAPITNKYYIYVYSSTTTLRKMYVFSDNNFSTLETTYSPTNVAFTRIQPTYIYDNYAFGIYDTTMYIADFVNNTTVTTYAIDTSFANCAYAENNTRNAGSLQVGTFAKNKYIFMLSARESSSQYTGYIYNMSIMSVVGYVSGGLGGSNNFSAVIHPSAENFLPCITSGGYYYNNCAIAGKKLDTPITKTDAYGMTATYELEVFWK